MNEATPQTEGGQLPLSIVVCSHNRAATLEGALTSLLRQSLAVSDYEVVVVDNASTDGTADVISAFAREHPNVRRVWEPRPGKSRALNVGTRASRGTYIAFTDDDVAVPPDWAERIVTRFSRGSGETEEPVAILGSVLPVFEAPPPSWLRNWIDADLRRRLSRSAGFLRPGRELYIAYGANTAYRRRALLEIGGFAEDWGPVGSDLRWGGEDTELVARLGAAFPRIWFEPDLCVEHKEAAATLTFPYRARRKYLEGIAVSRIEGTVLCSRRTLDGLLDLAGRLLGSRSDSGSADARLEVRADPHRPALDPTSRVMGLLLRAAVVVGRIRGARLLRPSRQTHTGEPA